MKKTPLLLAIAVLVMTSNVWAGKDDHVIIQEAAKKQDHHWTSDTCQ